MSVSVYKLRTLATLSSARGFTLIELIVVMVIAAVLAAIAIPNYSEYVVRSNRSAAQTFIADIASRQAQFFLGCQFAMTYPDRAVSFVTMTVGHPASLAEGSFTTEGARLSWYLMVYQTPVWGELWRAGNGRLARTALGSHPDVKTVLPHMLQPGVLEWYMMIDRANPITDFLIAYANGALPEMPPVNVPVFGIAGTKDQFMWRSQIENSGTYVKGQWRFAVVEAGHWIPLDAPRQTNKLLLDWLSQQRAVR